MRCILATLLLTILLCSVSNGQTSAPQPPNTPPNPAEISSPRIEPPMPPTPPDVRMPDLGTLPDHSAKKQSAVRRKLKELVPRCLDVAWGFHSRWSMVPASPPETISSAEAMFDPAFGNDMEVGDFYLIAKKNYAGAMLRFRDALEHKPDHPLATFRLAQSLEGLKQMDEARENYKAYLKLQPHGRFADQAKRALERVQTRAEKTSPKPADKGQELIF